MINCIAVFAEQRPTYYISEKIESDNSISVFLAKKYKITYNIYEKINT